MQYNIVGHVCKDIVPDGFRWGGTITYSGLMAAQLGAAVTGYTCAQPTLQLDVLHPNMEWRITPTIDTTTFQNVYNQGIRHQKVTARADDVQIPTIETTVDIVHLAPVADEIDLNIDLVLPPTTWLVATPQGWMRRIDDQGHVHRKAWESAERLLPYLHALVLSEEDVDFDFDIARSYAATGPVVLYTRDLHGAILLAEGQEIAIDASPAQVVDPTGAGDVIAAAFFVRLRETGDAILAARFGAAAAAIAIEHPGASGLPTRTEIEARMI